MIQKIEIKNNPNKQLLTSFVVRTKSEEADNLLVEFVSYEMLRRLRVQREKGFSGWNTSQCENSNLKERLLKNASRGDWIDVINLAAMLMAREQLFKEVPLGKQEVNSFEDD